MNLRARVFWRTAGLLTVLVVSVCAVAWVFTLRQHRRYEAQNGRVLAWFLARQSEDLILCDDRVALKALLDGLTRTIPHVEYAFLEWSGQKSIVGLSRSPGEIPLGAIRPVGDLPTTAALWTPGGEVIYDAAARVGGTDAVVHVGVSEQRANGEAFVVFRQIAGLGTTTLLFGLLLAGRIASRTTAEVARMNRALAESEANLRRHRDHLEEIVRSRTEELALANRSLEEDISRRRRVEAELAEARRLAEAANVAKSEFLANVSHEIRTPMTAIVGFAEVLLDSSDRAEVVDAARTIKRNADYLLRLLNDILDLSKVEAGKLETERVLVSPVALVAEVVSLMRVRAAAKNLPLTVEYRGHLPQFVRTDPTRLRQILVNLLGNAIKFTEVGKVSMVVQIRDATTAAPKLEFNVSDTGIGVSDRQLAKLFQPFTQGDSSTSRRFGGTGLGLTISKRLAEQLGGDITVASVLGEGSTFTLTIDPGPLDGVRMLCNPEEAALEKPASDAFRPPTIGPLQCRILLAEDGADNQRLIAFLLRKAGCEVTIVENGLLACQTVLSQGTTGGGSTLDAQPPFDLILMDVQMPLMDGYEATRRLRAAGYTGPIVALTAHAMSGDLAKCLAAGCDDYASKPIHRERLLGIVAKYACRPPATPGMPAAVAPPSSPSPA